MAKINIPDPDGIKKVIKKEGYTQDIIDSILKIDKTFYHQDFCKFALATFSRDEKGLRKLWNFVKNEIKYKRDPDGESIQGTPLATWRLKTGDCKNKTLFVNAVLRCLKIPYIIRFTNYEKGKKNVSHVYTIAILDNKKIPIDTVYDWYGYEKNYNKKIDYPMTEIIEISGLENDNRQSFVPQSQNCFPPFAVTENAKALEEIKQRQQYVKQPEPIAFSKISEAQAQLQVIERELKIIAVMQDEKAELARKGLELINRARKGDFCIVGAVPKELNKLADKITNLRKLDNVSAIGHGILGKRIRQAKRTNKDNSHEVAAFPERLCLNNQWYLTGPTSATDLTPLYSYAQTPGGASNYGFCTGAGPYDSRDSLHPFFGVGMSTYGQNLTGKQVKDFTFLFYGRNTPYRVSFKEYGEEWRNTIIPKLVTDGFASGLNQSGSGLESLWFNNDMDYNAALDIIKENSGVFDKFINDIYSANATQNPDGTVGSGLLYSFSNEIKRGGLPISLNNLPPLALSKMGFQNQFLDASNAYSGISLANIKGLARNGVLFDTGKQPNVTLQTLYDIYNPPPTGINIAPAIIAAIAAAVVAIIGAIAAAVAQCNKAENAAREIDTSLADTSRLSALGASLMPEQNDFMPGSNFGTGGYSGYGPGSGGSGNTNTSGGNKKSSNLLPIAALAAGGIYLYNKNKK